MNDNKKWSGRFSEPVAELVKNYTASVNFDKRMAQVDIQGSIAHATMLAENNIITEQDLTEIKQGLLEIAKDIKEDRFEWSVALEDVHMNIEQNLTAKIGDAGKRLHTGRSRNDQAATDIRLWLRNEIDEILPLITNLQLSLVEVAEENIHSVMPGLTHLQVAQPISFAHHLLAYVEMLSRDWERLQDCRKRVNTMPLGSAALAGTTYPIKRETTARLLNFERISNNSLDAVSDRDFAIEFNSVASLIMIHLSRLSEELILWMSPRFAFIDIADRFCTGSSIMPQKKNPDVPELVRGKASRVVGHLIALLILMKSQPLAYNKDNQEDKEPLFDTVDTVKDTLLIYADLIKGIRPIKENMRKAVLQGFATATDLADYLVKKGVPFRDSHEIVAQAVKLAESKKQDLSELPLEILQQFSPLIANDVYEILTPEGSLAQRDHLGGTAPNQVQVQIKRWKNILNS